jgi:hypothetical protein
MLPGTALPGAALDNRTLLDACAGQSLRHDALTPPLIAGVAARGTSLSLPRIMYAIRVLCEAFCCAIATTPLH